MLGGALTEALSWEWIFFVNVPIGVATAFAALRLVPNSRVGEGPRHFDLAGAVSVTAGLTLLVYAIVKAEDLGWGASPTLGVAALALALLALFILIERRTASPLVRLGLFRLRSLAVANGVFRIVAGALGLAVLSTVANDRTASVLSGAVGAPTHAQRQVALVDGYQLAFLVAAAPLAVGAALLAALLRRRDVERIDAGDAAPMAA
jgi:MFS family permease